MGRKIFAILMVGLFMYLSSTLILPVAMGAVLAVLLDPIMERMEKRKVPSILSSLLITFCVTIVLLLPMAMLIFFGAKSGFAELEIMKDSPRESGWIEAFLNTPFVHRLLEWITSWFPVGMSELQGGAQDLLHGTGIRLADFLGNMLAKLPGMAMALAVIIVSIYFFLIDGRKLVLFLRRNSIFTPPQTDQLVHSVAIMCRSVILASLVAGAAQGLFETLFCLSIGVPNALLVGSLVFMGSFIPLVGATPATLGVAVQQYFAGNKGNGIALLVASGIVLILDNLIRPLFLRGATHLHPLLAFIAVFGGLQAFGFIGVFLGPIIAIIFVSVIGFALQTGTRK